MHIMKMTWAKRLKMLGAVAVAVALASFLTIMNVSTSPAGAATGCWGSSPSTNGEGAAYANRGHYLRTYYTSTSCTGAYLAEGRLVYLQCAEFNQYGNWWWYVRIAGTSSYGWTSEDNLDLFWYDDSGDGVMEHKGCL